MTTHPPHPTCSPPCAAQLADAAIEEQLEVQTAFRSQGARLQAIYDRKQRAEYDMAKR